MRQFATVKQLRELDAKIESMGKSVPNDRLDKSMKLHHESF
jgi:hypothetical protein